MMRLCTVPLLIITLLASGLAAGLSVPAKPAAKQSYGKLLANVDTSGLPPEVKSSIALLTAKLKKQPGANCVQFRGRSGSGKTLAAALLAKGLGRDAYRVDLAAVMSKYIGETEKNLDRVFSVAAAHNWVLFFDEADALFGKRGEVKDAHDRYANIQANYLLTRLEEFQGIWIVSSNSQINLKPGLDKRCSDRVKFD